MKKTKIYSKYFVLPGLVLYIVFFVVPSFIGIYFSFTDWNRYSSEVKFVGLENYRAIFASGSNYLSYVRNTLNFTIISNIVKIIPALFLALLLSSNIRGQNVHRAILFFPALLPYLVIGLIFRSMLHPQTGFVNNMLRTLGLDFMAQRWLIDPKWVWPSIYAVDAWRGIGYVMTIYSGFELYTSSLLRGCRYRRCKFFQKLIHITLPMLKPGVINLFWNYL